MVVSYTELHLCVTFLKIRLFDPLSIAHYVVVTKLKLLIPFSTGAWRHRRHIRILLATVNCSVANKNRAVFPLVPFSGKMLFRRDAPSRALHNAPRNESEKKRSFFRKYNGARFVCSASRRTLWFTLVGDGRHGGGKAAKRQRRRRNSKRKLYARAKLSSGAPYIKSKSRGIVYDPHQSVHRQAFFYYLNYFIGR